MVVVVGSANALGGLCYVFCLALSRAHLPQWSRNDMFTDTPLLSRNLLSGLRFVVAVSLRRRTANAGHNLSLSSLGRRITPAQSTIIPRAWSAKRRT